MAFQFSQTGQELQYLANEVTQLAGDYDPTVSYVIGDYCNYQGTVYRCTAATTGTFDASDWTSSVIVMDAIKSLKARMTTAEGNISTAQGDITTAQGNITSINSILTQLSDVKIGASACGLTAMTGCTITNAWKLKIGRLVSYSLVVSVTTGADHNIVSGLEPPAGANGAAGLVRCLGAGDNTTNIYVSVSDNANVRMYPYPPSATTTLRFGLTYITTN